MKDIKGEQKEDTCILLLLQNKSNKKTRNSSNERERDKTYLINLNSLYAVWELELELRERMKR